MSPALLLLVAVHAAPQGELLDFTAGWCGPCQQMAPVVERLQRAGYPVRQIDVDRHRDVADRYGIKGIPAFVLVVDGREIDRKVGAQSEATLRHMLAKLPAPTTAVAETAPEVPPKKRWFEMPWAKKDAAPSAEPPQFKEEDAIYRGQPPEAPATPPSAAPVTAPAAARDPIETAVRIRVKDSRGVDYGSGTVIGSQSGKALVLTCWHIFREFGESATVKIEVDVFPEGPAGEVRTFPGELVRYDEKADVALVLVTRCAPMPVSPLAATDQFPQQGDHVFSVGCGEGKNPTKEQHSVTRLNPYLGPDTTQCTGMPVVGRSGGGLFDSEGRVIGVCFAAEREERRGVYVGPAEIHKLIEEANYAALIPTPGGDQLASAETPAVPEQPGPFDAMQDLGPPEPTSPPPEAAVGRAEPRPAFGPTGATAETAVALDDGVDMEATIILRPRNKPNAPSEVIVINKVTAKTLRYLRGDVVQAPVETALRIPADRLDRGRLMTVDLFVASARRPFVRASRSETTRRTADVALLARVFDNRR